MYFANIRITHRTAPQEIINFVNLRESEKLVFCERLMNQNSIDEVVLLQTCNRFELYLTGRNSQLGIAQAQKLMIDRFSEKIKKYMIVDFYMGAVEHLFKTVSSINSLIIGENQILTQVKEAYEFSRNYEFTSTVLNLVFQKTLSVGKKVRYETGISKGKVSISSAAVDLANQFNLIKNKKIILIGTGRIASLLAQYLTEFEPFELVVIGRTPSQVIKFRQNYCCRSVPFCELLREARTADVIFSATSCPSVVIKEEMMKKLMTERKDPIALIDIAVPCDIDPKVKDIPLVKHFSISDFEDLSYQNRILRSNEIVKTNEIIENELLRFNRKLQNLHKHLLLSHLMTYTEEIRKKETSKAIKILNASKKPNIDVIEAFSKSLIEKIMHNFIAKVKSSDHNSFIFDNFVDLFVDNKNTSSDTYETIEK
ncbi:MAG: glutamyl-tRNA reductase [Candidatus Bathyarchaeota archaeon]|nr:glutamyl-tRNA reductase [Candidatus Bathyarchaeum tardum]